VAIGAIGGAVGAEVGEYAPALKGADDFTSFARGAGQAALSNAISQGVDVATGLQHHFDWRGVAASAIAGGVNSEVGQTSVGKVPVLGNIVSGVASQTAGGVVLGGSMRDRLPRMIGAIAGNTVGSEIEQQLQSNSTSTLYGVSGNVDDLVAQSGYAADPGKQFAWLANSRLDPNSSFDTTAASLGLTPQQSRGLMAVDNEASIVDSSFSPEVVGYAVPYPQIAVTPMPGAGVMAAAGSSETALDAFVRGAKGGYAGVLDPNPSAAYAGNFLNDAAQSFKQFGYQMTGAQTADEARAAWNSENYGLATAKEFQAFGEAGLALMGLGSAARAATGPAMRAVTAAGEYAESTVAGLGDQYGLGLRLSVVEGSGTTPQFLTKTQFAELPETGRINPQVVRFSQDSAKANFKPPYGSIDEFSQGLMAGDIDPVSIEPIRIVERNDMVFTLDNRRLYSFQQAGVDVPYQKLDAIPKRELFKFTTQNDGVSLFIRGGGNGR
ncbi:hypothetical protein D7S89_27040, partial [Trinickia fusca]